MGKRERLEDTMLLTLNTEDGPMDQGVQAVARNWIR